MKGIVFTEFLEMVEEKFGIEVMDRIVTNANLPSQGSYTAIGTYQHAEMVALITQLHKETQAPVPVLLETFGKYLFGTFTKFYPQFFEGAQSCFDFLENIETFIHPQVLKLYPDAELPSFKTEKMGGDTLIMEYKSSRKMGDFAKGLILSAGKHFDTTLEVTQEVLASDGSQVKFTIVQK